jgi:hypothetical protein
MRKSDSMHVETYRQMHLVREWRKIDQSRNVGDWDRWDVLDMEDVLTLLQKDDVDDFDFVTH